jgi:hypothetical protein
MGGQEPVCSGYGPGFQGRPARASLAGAGRTVLDRHPAGYPPVAHASFIAPLNRLVVSWPAQATSIYERRPADRDTGMILDCFGMMHAEQARRLPRTGREDDRHTASVVR